MALVDYPDSDDDESTSVVPAAKAAQPPSLLSTTTKRKRENASVASSELPPLPASFHDLYATNARTSTSDDPSLHGGRKRQVPHVEGNWPTHVYLEWHPTPTATETLQALISRITNNSSKVHTLLLSDLDAPLPLHISLSRSLVLPTEKREEFLSRVRSNIKALSLKSFKAEFTKIAWYPNHERSRWFLSLSVNRPEKDELNVLLCASNAAASAMGQPELYVVKEVGSSEVERCKKRRKSQEHSAVRCSDCSDFFHISLAWSLEPQELGTTTLEAVGPDLKDLAATFDVVKVKIGNTVISLPLASKLSTSGKGFLI